MSTQPEALRLAKKLEEGYVAHETVLYPAAEELRRLHELNQELLAALKECIHFVEYDPGNVIGKKASLAIAKAEGEQNEL